MVNQKGKKPKCPHCRNILNKLYIREGSHRSHVGYFCTQCSGYKIRGHEIKKKIYSGLNEVEPPKLFQNYIISKKGV